MEVLEAGLAPEEYQRPFERDGFVAVSVLTLDELTRLRHLVKTIVRATGLPEDVHVYQASDDPLPQLPENPFGVHKIMNVPRLGGSWLDLMVRPEIVKILEALLGPDVDFVMGFVRVRVPRLLVLGEGWHRDWDSERHDTGDLVTAIMYLDDMGPDTGPTELVAGSHLMDAPPEAVMAGCPRVTRATVPAGTVLFLHSLTTHRAGISRGSQSVALALYEYRAAANKPVDSLEAFALANTPVLRGGVPVLGGTTVKDEGCAN